MRLDLFNSKIDRLIAQPPLVFVVVAYETFLALSRTVLNYFCTMYVWHAVPYLTYVFTELKLGDEDYHDGYWSDVFMDLLF